MGWRHRAERGESALLSGFDVWMLDWGIPDERDADTGGLESDLRALRVALVDLMGTTRLGDEQWTTTIRVVVAGLHAESRST